MRLDGSMCSECLPVVTLQFSRLKTPRTRTTDLGQGPHLHCSIHAGLLRAPQPRARAKSRRRERKKCRCAKKVNLVHGNIQQYQPGLLGIFFDQDVFVALFKFQGFTCRKSSKRERFPILDAVSVIRCNCHSRL